MRVPLIAGLPLHAWIGMLLLILIILQILIGKRILKIPFVWHRVFAIVILVFAVIHAVMGLGLMLWGFTIG